MGKGNDPVYPISQAEEMGEVVAEYRRQNEGMEAEIKQLCEEGARLHERLGEMQKELNEVVRQNDMLRKLAFDRSQETLLMAARTETVLQTIVSTARSAAYELSQIIEKKE